MAKVPKDTGVSLLQKNAPAAGWFIFGKSARRPPSSAPFSGPLSGGSPDSVSGPLSSPLSSPISNSLSNPVSNRMQTLSVRRGSPPNWPLRISLALLLVAGDLLLIGNKDRLLSNFGYRSVPALPLPGAHLSVDEQALYWTYALYDIGKLRARFHVEGYYAIRRGYARHELERLLPSVSPAILGEISAYGPAAFRSVKQARRE